MASRLIHVATHEAENLIELSLREAFELLEPQLRPPFPLRMPTQPEYLNLNMAILYGILCEPQMANAHIKHLHGIIMDGYGFFTSTLITMVNELYEKLVDSVKVQLIWVTSEMVNVSAIGVDALLVALLRQIVGGDFSEGNLWLCSELVGLLLAKWDCLLEEEPLVLTSALYVFLRLLADHYRVLSNSNIEVLKRMEIDFCLKLLREHFHLCLKIGRDLVRLLQELVHIPEFRAIWKDLLLNPAEFKVHEFLDISQLYHLRTSSRYFLLRITPEMESQLRFLLTHVKFGSQKRYQIWFAKKFLCTAEKETLVIDIVRFICCAHHPPNEIILSDVIPRWAVVGWLLKCCRKNYVEANVKLALFYDWLFFDERVDNIMNIEPAVLLMVNSISKYVDMTHTLLEFLFLLVDTYDADRKDIVIQGVQSALDVLVRKGVVQSLDVLTSSDMLSPFLKERLRKLLSDRKVLPSKQLHPSRSRCHTLLPISFPLPSRVESGALPGEMAVSACRNELGFGAPNDESVSSFCLLSASNGFQVHDLENLVQNIGETIRSSKLLGLQTLDKILLSYVNLATQEVATNVVLSPEALSCKITKEFESSGIKLFEQNWDVDIQSATALVMRYLIFSQHESMQDMFLNWSRKGFPVGACLLSYASKLAHAANVLGYLTHWNSVSYSNEVNESGMSLLKLHFEQYSCFMSGEGKEPLQTISPTAKMDNKIVAILVDGAFAAYRCFVMHVGKELSKEPDKFLAKILFCDLMSYAKSNRKGLKFSLYNIVYHLPDLFIGEENIMKLIVCQLDYSDLLDIQFDVGLKKLSLFGESTEIISHLIKSSFHWDCIEQHKFWGLLRSELAVSKVPIEKVLLEFFCMDDLDPNFTSIAVSGLLALCSSCAPTPELVGAVILLPNNKFTNFATAVLAAWAVSNASMLLASLAKFMEKLNYGDSIISDMGGVMVNNSAFIWLLDFLDARGVKGTSTLSNLCVNIPEIKSMLRVDHS